MKTVAIIPCYNVEKFCKATLDRVVKRVDSIVAIDDGSTDHTGQILSVCQIEYPDKIHVIVFKQNRGKGVGLITGFKYATAHLSYDALITFDCDGQHTTSLIPELFSCIKEGADMAIGCRHFEEMPLRSRFGNTIISWLLRLRYHKSPVDTQSGMRAFSKEFVSEIASKVKEGRYETEFRCLLLALSQNRRIATIRIPTIYLDKNRSSHFSAIRDTLRILKVFGEHLIRDFSRAQ